MHFHYLPLTTIAYIFMIFVLLTPVSSYASKDTEEQEKQLATLPDDTAKVNALLALGEKYCSKENDKALMYLQHAFTIATSLNYEIGMGKSLLWQGRVYYYKDDYNIAMNYLEKARKILENTDDFDDLAFLCFAEGSITNLNGDYIHTIEMFEKTITLSQKTGNLKLMSTCYGGMGNIMLARGEPEKSLEYYKEALSIKKNINHKAGIANIYTGIANAYESMVKLDSALKYYNKALAIRTELKNERTIANSEYNIAGILVKQKKYKEAEKALEKAKKIYIGLKERTGLIVTNLRLAVAMNKLGNKNAVNIADNALKMAENINNPNLISFAYKTLAGIYAENLDFKDAYKFQTKYKHLEDSLFNTEKERILSEMEAKFQLEKKDNKIKLLKNKTEAQRKNTILLISIVVVFAIVIILLFLLFRLKSTAFNRQQKLLEQEKIINSQQKKIAEKENQLLLEQLESKNRELASKALEMLRYNDTISSIISRLETLHASLNKNSEADKPIRDIIHQLENHTKQNIWKEFEKIFKNIHSGFYDKLLSINPELTPTEIKIAALLKLNLTTKEIAAIAFKSEGGIKTARYRLRKKLGLSSDDKLVPFLMQI